MIRGFEKISFEQFKKDIKDDQELYGSYGIPVRKTKNSAGYDFEAIEKYVIKPNEILLIPTGVKANMKSDEFLMLVVRSSMGFKYNVRLVNQVGIIDSDYYDNSNNEGHIWIKLQNEGNADFVINKKDGIMQGIFNKYLIASDEDEIDRIRKGGIGSTTISEV